MAVEDLTAALRRRTAERDHLKARLEQAERPRVMSAAQISELVEELGGLSAVLGEATGAERAQVYASLGLRLDYDPHLRQVKATADLSRVAGCVIAAAPLNTLPRLGNGRERPFRLPQSGVRGGT
nr:kinetochore protein SPC24 [Mycobacterium talmoniae]